MRPWLVDSGRRLGPALDSVDFCVAVDMYVTETTRHADIILPPISPLGREDVSILFSLFSVRNNLRYDARVFEPPADGLEDWLIMARLITETLPLRAPVHREAAERSVRSDQSVAGGFVGGVGDPTDREDLPSLTRGQILPAHTTGFHATRRCGRPCIPYAHPRSRGFSRPGCREIPGTPSASPSAPRAGGNGRSLTAPPRPGRGSARGSGAPYARRRPGRAGRR